jgi:hypothetical protein
MSAIATRTDPEPQRRFTVSAGVSAGLIICERGDERLIAPKSCLAKSFAALRFCFGDGEFEIHAFEGRLRFTHRGEPTSSLSGSGTVNLALSRRGAMGDKAKQELEKLQRQLAEWEEELRPDAQARAKAAQKVLDDVKALVRNTRNFNVEDLASDGSSFTVGFTGQPAHVAGVRVVKGNVQIMHLNKSKWAPFTKLRYDPVAKAFTDGVDDVVVEVVRILREDAQQHYKLEKARQEAQAKASAKSRV